MKKFDLQTKKMHLAAVRAQVSQSNGMGVFYMDHFSFKRKRKKVKTANVDIGLDVADLQLFDVLNLAVDSK